MISKSNRTAFTNRICEDQHTLSQGLAAASSTPGTPPARVAASPGLPKLLKAETLDTGTCSCPKRASAKAARKAMVKNLDIVTVLERKVRDYLEILVVRRNKGRKGRKTGPCSRQKNVISLIRMSVINERFTELLLESARIVV